MSKNRKISRKRFVKLYASRHPHMLAAKDAAEIIVWFRRCEEECNRLGHEKIDTGKPIWKGMWDMEESAG